MDQIGNELRKKGINANLSLIINWLSTLNQGNPLIRTVFRLSNEIYFYIQKMYVRCEDLEMKEETIDILKNILDWVNETNEDWDDGTFIKQDKDSIYAVYVSSIEILIQIGLVIPSSVECGNLI